MEVEDREFSGKIRILMVDTDSTCLLITVVSLKKSKFEVTTVKSAKDALAILRSSILSFDLVVTEVHMPEMDGFQLQQEISKESNIPVVFFSVDGKECTAMKGLQSGVIFFIVKPISQDDIHHLWEYVTLIKKKKEVVNQKNTNVKIPHEAIYIESSSSNDERDKSARKYDDTENDQSSSPPSKKTRIVWTVSRHDKFLEALMKLGLEKAHPREILKLMDTPELTRIHIASHLQKYRMSLQKDNFGNANQLSTKKAIDNISASAQQVMINNLNSASYDTEVDHQNLQNDRRDILYRQKPLHTGYGENFVSLLPESSENTKEGGSGTKPDGFSMLDNVYAIPHSTNVATASFESQQNIQSSNVQEDYGCFTEEHYSFLDNALNQELENKNYGDATTEKGSFQLHNDHPNSKFEQGDYVSFTAEECSILHNIFLNQEHKQGNTEDVTIEQGSFQLHYDHLNSKFEV